MRAFVALELPTEALRQIDYAVAILEEAPVPPVARPTKVRWVRPGQAHLTLRFLGDVNELQFQTIIDDLGREFRLTERCLNLRFGNGGAFPSAAKATVLWLALEGSKGQLSELARIAESAAQRAGLEPSDRPFRPHVTLARFQPPSDVSGLLESLRIDGPDWKCRLVSVIQSDLRPAGPEYRELARIDLSAARIAL